MNEQMYGGYGYFGYGMPGYNYGQPMMQQNIQVPQNQNALTAEEIQKLLSARPSAMVLNLNIDQDEVLRAMCTHKRDGKDLVQLVNDGSGDVYCPICGERWNPESASKEEVKAHVDFLIAQMQNSKWTGELPANVVREYYSMIPLIKKFPEIFEYGNKNFEKYLNQRGYYNAADANIYAQYNGLFGPGMGYGQPIYQNMYGAPVYNTAAQPMGQPMPQPQQMGQMANPAMNPMQAQQPLYPGYNQQFGDQANMMMGGTYYAQAPQMTAPYAPQFGAVAPQAPVQQPVAAPAATPAPTQQAPATATTETKVEL